MINSPVPSNTALQILRLPQVIQITGLCRSMIYQLESADRFPHRIRIGPRAVGWLHGEIQQWLEEQIIRSRRPSKNDASCPPSN